MRPIQIGSIVKFNEKAADTERNGSYRISSLRGGKVNLKSIFGKTIYYKNIPIDQVVECEDEWYEAWSKSETYMCM